MQRPLNYPRLNRRCWMQSVRIPTTPMSSWLQNAVYHDPLLPELSRACKTTTSYVVSALTRLVIGKWLGESDRSDIEI